MARGDLAKEGGANAAKFQTYKAHKLASKESPSYWDTSKETTKSQYELFQKYDKFSKDDYYNLSEYCQKVGIDFLSTPFDDDAVDFREGADEEWMEFFDKYARCLKRAS